MCWSGLSGEGALMESALLGLGPVNVARARHDLRTLAGLLPRDLDDPLGQLQALGDDVAAGFTIPRESAEVAETRARDGFSQPREEDPALFDVGRALIERRGDEWLVAGLVATIGQGVGWDVAVVAGGPSALVAHRECGPPLAISIAEEGRLVDVGDLPCGPQLRWRCPCELAAAIEARAALAEPAR